MKNAAIIGARPLFIKAAVVSRAVENHNSYCGDNSTRIQEVIVHTGQHYDRNRSDVFFEEWVELVEHGFNYLAGAETENIYAACKNIANIKYDSDLALYGDGTAGEKIVNFLAQGGLFEIK